MGNCTQVPVKGSTWVPPRAGTKIQPKAPAPGDGSPNLQKYTSVRKVGEGAFGKVWLMKDKKGSPLVCKVMDLDQMSSKEIGDAKKEAALLKQLNNSSIVRYRDSFLQSDSMYILMDYCEGGDLRDVIEQAQNDRQRIGEEQILRWMTQVADGLKYIHSKHILHRDLKPDNIFLSKSKDVKLGDFGLATKLSCTADCARTFCGTLMYFSPEVSWGKPYTWTSDIWAMGCILYELCELKRAFDCTSMKAILQKIRAEPIPRIGCCSDFVKEFCADMLSRNAASRPSAALCVEKFKQAQKKETIKKASTQKGQRKGAIIRAADNFCPILQATPPRVDRGSAAPIKKEERHNRRKVDGPRFAAVVLGNGEGESDWDLP